MTSDPLFRNFSKVFAERVRNVMFAFLRHSAYRNVKIDLLKLLMKADFKYLSFQILHV